MKRKKREPESPPTISSGLGFTGSVPRSSFKPQSGAAHQNTEAPVDLNALRDEVDYERERQMLERRRDAIKIEQAEQGEVLDKRNAAARQRKEKEQPVTAQLTDREDASNQAESPRIAAKSVTKERISASSAPTPMPARAEASRQTQAELIHSDDYRSIRFQGEAFTLTTQQAQVVQQLDEAFKAGTPDLSHAQILERIGVPDSRLRDTFKTNPGLWGKGKLIISTRRGTVRLNLSDTPKRTS